MNCLTRLQIVLATRGMTTADLAALTGLGVGTLYNLACGNNTTRSGRAKVESALGVKIWPTPTVPAAAASKTSGTATDSHV